MKHVFLTDAAEASLLDIGAYTERTWGRKQRIAYMTALNDAVVQLARYPEKGYACNELREGLRCLNVRKHAIFYLIRPDSLLVVDILHQQMDPALHLHIEHNDFR